ncbi:L-ascorbate metabolism protein UlaG, beta-lactamase superfamily [Mesonia phycicola]|uniref:L-ascorbate metabolism protein UlaG, beta-lactamase superfamily n=1 Tax=Mesonia phycicola TaxID=579105 RepID=A0A1M6E2P6_9FLAO|nr:MBL fold metallo-hydrolase [Mesonia phycicola]SHI79777.1 L-ascorbate metabolism protein UlaG, beta-lactamase superfamily [Mesonia phycicola]
MKNIFFIACLSLSLFACKEEKKETQTEQEISPAVTKNLEENKNDSIAVMPVEHASFAIELNQKTFYFDPVGGSEKFSTLPKPDIIFVTDIHPDHLNPETLTEFVDKDSTLTIVCPQAVKDQLPTHIQKNAEVISNGEKKSWLGVEVEAIPMYNLREEALKYHAKGRGNGYVLNANQKRIYVSGDTEDIPEMRHLKDIDIAFVCMNLPYTMPVEAAADAVLDFKPKKVYPYHYRGKEKMSDPKQFKNIVTTNNPAIKVEILDWY